LALKELMDDARRGQVLRAIRDRGTIVGGQLDLLQGGNGDGAV
jgi:sensor domain CHASE-containing protein